MTKVFESITKWLRRKRLLRKLRSKDFDKVVGAVHTILEDSKFYEGVRPNNLPPLASFTGGIVDGAVHPWTLDRPRAYTVVQILVYLEHQDLAFPFYNYNKSPHTIRSIGGQDISRNMNDPSIVLAMMKAIDSYGCFEKLSYKEFVKFYNRSGWAKWGSPDYAIQLPEDDVTLLGSRIVPYGPEVDSHLIDQFNPETFNEFVDIIYDVLCEVELTRFPKGFAMEQEDSGGETDWQISRERVYVILPFLHFLKDHSRQFPFQRQEQAGDETIIDAMLLAISRFNCFKNYSHDELLEFYNRKSMPMINIWGEDIYNDLGILVKRPRAGYIGKS
jgi:hypothetical protein